MSNKKGFDFNFNLGDYVDTEKAKKYAPFLFLILLAIAIFAMFPPNFMSNGQSAKEKTEQTNPEKKKKSLTSKKKGKSFNDVKRGGLGKSTVDEVYDNSTKFTHQYVIIDGAPRINAIQSADPWIISIGKDSVKIENTALKQTVIGVRNPLAENQLPQDIDSTLLVYKVQFQDPMTYPGYISLNEFRRNGQTVAIQYNSLLFTVSDDLHILLAKPKKIDRIQNSSSSSRKTKKIRVYYGLTVSRICSDYGMSSTEFFNLNPKVRYSGLQAGAKVIVYD